MINVTGYIKNTNGEPIPGASVVMFDQYGVDMGFGTAANNNGFFAFWVNETDPRLPYAKLQISSVGYKIKTIDFDTYGGGQTIYLETNVVTLPPVVVTSDKEKYLWLIALAGGAFLLLNDDKKSRRVSGVADKFRKLPKPVQYIAYGVGGYALYRIVSSFMQHKNPTKTPGELAAELPTLPAPTYPDTQFSIWCDRIQQQFDGCDFSIALPGQLTESAKVLNSILKQLNNDADFAKLVISYGVREYDNCGPFTGNFRGNLNQAVTDELASVEIPIINKTLESRGIKYRF